MENHQNHPPPPPYLQRVRELRNAGTSERRIAARLEAEGVPLPPGRKKWNQGVVRAVLQQLQAPPAPLPPSEREQQLQRQIDALQRQIDTSRSSPPRIDRDMPPLGGPGWVPEGWRPRVLLGLLVLAVLGAGALVLQLRAELRTYHGVWAAMTPEEQEENNQRRRAPASPTKAPPGDS